jgi:hypothetical protein
VQPNAFLLIRALRRASLAAGRRPLVQDRRKGLEAEQCYCLLLIETDLSCLPEKVTDGNERKSHDHAFV